MNNAGIATFQEIEWCSVTQFQQIMDVNVIGVVRVTKAFLPLLREGEGRVINVASLAGEKILKCPLQIIESSISYMYIIPFFLYSLRQHSQLIRLK